MPPASPDLETMARTNGLSPRHLVRLSVLAAFSAATAHGTGDAGSSWRSVAKGFEIGRFETTVRSEAGDSTITAVRIDPASYSVELFSAVAGKIENWPTGADWAEREKLAAAINGGMFEIDGRTTGYSRQGETVVNPKWSNAYRSALVAEPTNPKLPAVQLLDRECDDSEKIAAQYRVVLQGVRMVDCHGKNVWQVDPKKWSAAALAIDGNGRLLLLAARSPYTMHAFVDELLAQRLLDVRRAMYLEGGPEVSLIAQDVNGRLEVIGRPRSESTFDDGKSLPWRLPNVLGFKLRAGAGP